MAIGLSRSTRAKSLNLHAPSDRGAARPLLDGAYLGQGVSMGLPATLKWPILRHSNAAWMPGTIAVGIALAARLRARGPA
jgi:hypothetical protein